MIFTRLWLMLHEPRSITATMTVSWLIVFTIGISAFVVPPATVQHALGTPLMLAWAALLTIGGALGLVGCPLGWWWVERAGIFAGIAGMLVYLFIVLFLQYTQGGSRLVLAGFISLGIVSLAVRYLRIRGAQLDPMRGIREHDLDT